MRIAVLKRAVYYLGVWANAHKNKKPWRVVQIAFLQGKHKGVYIDVHDRSAHAAGKAFTGYPEKDLQSKDFLGRGATSV